MSKLTSTTYALLGLLSKRSWSAYDLTKYMRRSAIRVVWPRAESGIIREPKKLVAEGFATVRHEQASNRTRAIYDITDEGRVALERWQRLPSKPMSYEYESLLKLLQMNVEDPRQLVDKISEMAQETRDQYVTAEQVMLGIASKGFTLNGRGVQNVLVNMFIQEMNRAVLDWATLAQKTVSEIPDNLDEKETDAWALERYRELIDSSPLRTTSDK